MYEIYQKVVFQSARLLIPPSKIRCSSSVQCVNLLVTNYQNLLYDRHSIFIQRRSRTMYNVERYPFLFCNKSLFGRVEQRIPRSRHMPCSTDTEFGISARYCLFYAEILFLIGLHFQLLCTFNVLVLWSIKLIIERYLKQCVFIVYLSISYQTDNDNVK